MTDIETREAMRASWIAGWEKAKDNARDAMREYHAALHLFIDADSAYDGWVETGGQVVGYPLLTEWKATKQRLGVARTEYNKTREYLDEYLRRMGQA